MRLAVCIAAVTALWACAGAVASAPSDPYCTGSYGGAAPKAGPPLRFGIDPGLAGSAGGAQLPSTPDDPARDLAAVKELTPAGRVMVVRLNRLFWSDGQSGIDTFKQMVARYVGAGFDVELQVRYHPPSGEAGDIPAWLAYVRHVVDTFGPDRHVVAMTITNEVNVTFSPNTSDGYYSDAEEALIEGIEAAHAEALEHHFGQLRFGFTYAYRFSPQGDASFFSSLGTHGGSAFRRALSFVGVDFYPGSIYPPYSPSAEPGDSYQAELAQAAGVVRDCLAPKAGITAATPIWFTEVGVPTGVLTDAQQAAALQQLVQAARAYSGTFNITDFRWFNLRDSSSSSPADYAGPTFSSDGLLRDDYTAKPSFGVYRQLIAALGERVRPARARARPRGERCDPRAHRRARKVQRRGVRQSCARSVSPKRR